VTNTKSPATGGSPEPTAIGRTVLLLGMAAFASVATMRVADPLIPQVADEFQVSAGDAAVISSSYTIAYAIGQFVYGPLGDRFGKLKLIAWMTMISGLTVAAAGLAGSLQSLGFLRMIGGATAAAIVPLSMAFIGDHVTYEHRQTMLARMTSGTIAGLILGQIFGGLIGEHFGWRAVFPLLGLAFLMIGALLFHELRRESLPAPKLSPEISISSMIASYSGIFRLLWARVVILAVFIEAFFFYGAFTFIGADLHERFALNYGTIGLLLSIFGLGGIVYTLTVSRLIGNFGERGLASIGGLCIAISLLSLPFAPLLLIPISQFVLGFGSLHAA